MAKARGKHAYGFCDRTGFRYPIDRLVKEEDTGLVVGYDVADARHPQDYPHEYIPYGADPQALEDPRPDIALDDSRKMFSWDPVGVGNLGILAQCGRTDYRTGRATIGTSSNPDTLSETFESGYSESWVENLRIGGADATLPTMDPTGAVPDGVSDWGDSCLRVTITGDGDGTESSSAGVYATIETYITKSTYHRLEFDFVLESETLLEGDQLSIANLRASAAEASRAVTINLRRENTGPEDGNLVLKATVMHDGSSNDYETAIAVDTVYHNEFVWDLDTETWSWSINESTIGSGSLTGVVLTEPRQISYVRMGTHNNSNDIPATYCLDNIVTAHTP